MGELLFPGNIKYWIGGISGFLALLGYLISGIVLISNMDGDVRRLNQHVEDIDSRGSRAMVDRVNIMNEHLLTLEKRENNRNTEIERVAVNLEHRVQAATEELAKADQATAARITAWEDTLRSVGIFATRQTEVFRRLDNIETQIHLLSDIKNSVELERADIKRLDEQQNKIIQALDNTYNTLQEALRGQAITRQPTPGQSLRPF